MKSALLANLAMCVCAPAVVATTAMTVPPIRQAVHKAVAHAAKQHAPHRRAAALASHPCAPGAERGSDDPAAILAALGQPVDGASSALREPTALADMGSRHRDAPADLSLPLALNGGGAMLPDLIAAAPRTPPVSTIPVMPDPAAAVPEPSSWAMMLGGFGAIGMLIRGRRTRRVRVTRRAAALAACAGGIADLSTGAAAVVARTGFAGPALKAAVLKNAGVCVCSAAAMAAAVTTVPPLRQAVFAATMPPHAASASCQADG